MGNGQLENVFGVTMRLFGSQDFFWGVTEDKVLFVRWDWFQEGLLNALIFLNLELDGQMFNMNWHLTPDMVAEGTWKRTGVIFFCILVSGIFF